MLQRGFCFGTFGVLNRVVLFEGGQVSPLTDVARSLVAKKALLALEGGGVGYVGFLP